MADSAVEQNAEALAVIQRLDLSPERWRASLHELGLKMVACQHSECALFLQRMIAAETARDPQFLALIGAEIPELTEHGTKKVDDEVIRRAVDAGVATFLRASTRTP